MPLDDPWLSDRMHDHVEFRRAERILHPAVEKAVTAFLKDVHTALLGPPRRRAVTAATEAGGDETVILSVDSAFPTVDVWIAQADRFIGPAARQVFTDSWQRTVQPGPRAARRRNRSVPRAAREAARRFADRVGDRVQGFARNVRNRLDRVLRDALSRDLPVAEVRAALARELELDRWQGQVMDMTRTETTTGINSGGQGAAEDRQEATGQRWTKTWMATADDRTRPTHRTADRQTVPLSAKFRVGRALLSYPGDPTGPPEEIMNCRCSNQYKPASEAPVTPAEQRPPRREPTTTLPLAALPPTTHHPEATMPTATPDTETAAAPGTVTVTASVLDALATDNPDAPIEMTSDGRWRGALGLMNQWSSDMRMLLAPDDGVIKVRPLPLPLLVQGELAPGHDKGKLGVGRIDRIWADGDLIMGEGQFDVADPFGAELARKVGEGYIRFVSLDVDNVWEAVSCVDDEGRMDPDCDPTMGDAANVGRVMQEWRVMGATLLAYPAFPDAYIALADDDPAVLSDELSGEHTQADLERQAAEFPPLLPGLPTAGTYDCGEVHDSDMDPSDEGPVGDVGHGCVVPDPGSETGWSPGPCDREGSLPANAEQDGPADEVVDAVTAAIMQGLRVPAVIRAGLGFAVDTSLPWAPRGRSWDGPAAAKRVADWARKDDGNLDPAKMSKAFLVVSGPPQNVGSYRFPVADIVNGEPHLVWSGLTAAYAALQGARATPDLSSAEKKSALGKVAALYKKAAKAFDDPSILDLDGAMSLAELEAFTATDNGYGCVCPGEDADGGMVWRPCACSHDDAETADADGNPAPWDEDDMDDGEGHGDWRDKWSRNPGCKDCTPAAILASASGENPGGWLPPGEHFSNPGFSDIVPVHVDLETGRISGYVATWGTCHVGFADKCIVPPKSPSDYTYFRTARIATTTGDVYCGVITMDTGHASLGDNARGAVAHYDHTGTQAAVVVCGEDMNGIWVSGSVLPFLNDEEKLRLSLARYSGDWREIRGGAEMVAILAVNRPGFPVVPAQRTGVDNKPYALVAAGMLPPAVEPEADVPVSSVSVGTVTVHTMSPEEMATRVLAEIDRRKDVEFRFAEARRKMFEFRAQQAALRIGSLREAWEPFVMGSEATPEEVEFATNWVEKVGGLPAYIKRIAKHLQEKGFDKSHAIATAVNVVKKMCSSADVNWPGKQTVNPTSRAAACKAVAEWEAKKAAS